MNHIEIISVTTTKQMEKVEELGRQVWHEHYTPIIGAEQVAYMLNKFQSFKAIENQINKEGYTYYLLKAGAQYAGYGAIKIAEGKLFLSKLYVDKAYRNQRIGHNMMEFLVEFCKEKTLDKIWLTVNKDNKHSIAAYEKFGFVKVDEQVADIGNGYVMDDYIMEKKIECI